MDDLLHTLSACAAVDGLRQGELSPSELIAALEQRVSAVNPALNALPTTCFERARAWAAALEKLPPGERGVLAGLPVPIKDSYEVEGVRTTWGSRAFADHIAARSDYCVQAIEAAGGVVYAKSNTPEFEALEYRFVGGGIVRWGRGGGRQRHGLHRARIGLRLLGAVSGGLLQYRRPQAQPRPRAARAQCLAVPGAVGDRAAGPQRRRCGARPRWICPLRPARSAVAAGIAHGLPGRRHDG
jgi:hypothetical protein